MAKKKQKQRKESRFYGDAYYSSNSGTGPKETAAERVRKGKQEQVDEIADLMRQLNPDIQAPRVKS